MNDDSMKVVITGIKTRKPVTPFVALSEIIETTSLSDRHVRKIRKQLCDAGLIRPDDDDVQFEPGDVLFTGNALERSEEILENYVGEVVYNKFLTLIRLEEEWYDKHLNALTEALRKASVSDLWEACETDPESRELYEMELRERCS